MGVNSTSNVFTQKLDPFSIQRLHIYMRALTSWK